MILELLDQVASGLIAPDEAVGRWPDDETPWALAWRDALRARPLPVTAAQIAGLRHAARHDDFEPRLRPVAEVAARVAAMGTLSALADAISEGLSDGVRLYAQRYADLQVHPMALEHPEAMLMLALGQSMQPQRGVVLQVSWRSEATAALLWALGLREWPPAFEPDAVKDGADSLMGQGLRPLAEIRALLDASRAKLSALEPNTLPHAVTVEHVKALRWVSEPWWPELSLTPWRAGDRRKMVHAGDVEAERADLLGGAEMRSPMHVMFRATISMLHSWLADAVHRDDHDAKMAVASWIANLKPPHEALEPREAALLEDLLGKTPMSPEDRTQLVWQSASADALWWALGWMDDIPAGDGDPTPFLKRIPNDLEEMEAAMKAATLRPQAEIETELASWVVRVQGANEPSMAHSWCVERVRALRWVLNGQWTLLSTVPWREDSHDWTHGVI